MKALQITHPTKIVKSQVELPASKSISNRLLIIKALSPLLEIFNLSGARDTMILQRELKKISDTGNFPGKFLRINAEDAGTTFRFLAAYLACIEGSFLLDGSARMKERPVKPLVDGLKQLGADVHYADRQEFPPLLINGKKLERKDIEMDASISSQFISALLLVSPVLKGEDFTVKLTNVPASLPYLDMSIALMNFFGIEVKRWKNEIFIPRGQYRPQSITVEPDWSAAQYWLQMALLAKEADLFLPKLGEPSLQGDSIQVKYFNAMGLNCNFFSGGLKVEKKDGMILHHHFPEDFSQHPDLLPSFAVLAAIGRQAHEFRGVKNLRIKETDRLAALENELVKIGANINFTGDDRMLIEPAKSELPDVVRFKTYNDHRMAMALAPLALKGITVIIDDAQVVNKSYPTFWQELQKAGFCVQEIAV